MRKCIKCDKETDISITPDIDIDGIAVCENCKDEVLSDMQLALIYDNMLKRFYKKYGLSR